MAFNQVKWIFSSVGHCSYLSGADADSAEQGHAKVSFLHLSSCSSSLRACVTSAAKSQISEWRERVKEKAAKAENAGTKIQIIHL